MDRHSFKLYNYYYYTNLLSHKQNRRRGGGREGEGEGEGREESPSPAVRIEGNLCHPLPLVRGRFTQVYLCYCY